MRPVLLATVGLVAASSLGACASSSSWASACERDYQRNRAAATAAGALVGAGAGAAIARDDAAGAAQADCDARLEAAGVRLCGEVVRDG